MVENLVAKRDERRDGFSRAVKQAMTTKLGDDAEEVLKTLTQNGIPRSAAKDALAIARREGRFTVFSLVDALTRLSHELKFAGARTEADQKASSLLELVV